MTASFIYNILLTNNMGVSMRKESKDYLMCKHHPNIKLDETTIKVKQTVPWSDEPIHIFQDIQFCIKCWENHENGGVMVHELVMTEKDNLEQQVENYIERRV
jgi:hypothetical protein